MFDENENSYPVKPELLIGDGRRNRLAIFLFLAVLVYFVTNYLSDAYLVLAEVFVVLLVHELGHYLMMRKFNVRAQGMFFMSFLGKMTKSLRFSDSQRQQTLINIMGPLPGLVLGSALFMFVMYYGPNVHLIELAILLLGINLLNLLPIDPFDGGRIVGGFFFSRDDSLKMTFTLVSSVVIIAGGVYFSFIPLIIFGFLMGLKVRSFQKSKELHDQLDETNVNYRKDYSDLTDREYWKIRTVFLMNNPKLKEMIPSGFTLWDNERLLMEQVRQVLRVKMKSDISAFGKVAIVFIMLAIIVAPILLVMSNYELIDWYIENAQV